MPRTYAPLAFILILALSLMACQTLETLTLVAIPSQAAISPTANADQPATSQPATSPTAASSITGPEKPNIVFILTDDQDKASIAYMPKLQEYLVKRGVTFTNYIVNVSLCCPSRSTTLRGQYAHNTQILTNNGDNGGYGTFLRLGLEYETVATWLQADSYRTVLLGKYLNGYPGSVGGNYIPPGWTEWYSPVKGNAYSEYNYALNENGEVVSYGRRPDDYETDVLAGHALDFIRRNVSTGQPFFMYLATYAPHAPANPAPRHANEFTDKNAPQTPAYNEADVSDKPQYIQSLDPLNKISERLINNAYVKRLQSLQAVDEMIEKLVNTLEATGQLDNTYIFFASDNGFHLGQHRMLPGKQAPYEEDINVPFLAMGPGIPAGQTRAELVGNVDLAATFADIGGVELPDFLDGRSLLPLLSREPAPPDWRQAYLIQHVGKQDGETGSAQSSAYRDAALASMSGLLEPPDLDELKIKAGIPSLKGLRTLDYTYVEYDTGERELYDLKTDPDQLNNLVNSADPKLIQELSDWLAKLSVCKGAECRLADQKPDQPET